MRRVVFENALKRAQRYLTQNMEKSPCKLNLLHCRQKPRPLCETGTKRKLEKQGKCGHRLIMHSITRRGEIWGGGSEVRIQWEGRGWAAPLCQLMYEPGEMVWQYIYFSTLIKKGTFTHSDSNPRDSRNQEMWHWCSQIASDYMKSCFNPLHLISAPPPPTSSAPSFSDLVPYRHPC